MQQVDEESDIDSDDSNQAMMTIEQKQDSRTPPKKVHIELDKVRVPMEVDTGASVSLMAENTYTSCGT